MNKDKMKLLKEAIIKIFQGELDLKKLNDLRVEYLGKTGKITELSKGIRDVSNEDKKEYGLLVNELRTLFEEKYENIKPTKSSSYKYL